MQTKIGKVSPDFSCGEGCDSGLSAKLITMACQEMRDMSIFDAQGFVDDCLAAVATDDPIAGVSRVMEKAISDPAALLAAVDKGGDGVVSLCMSETLTALQVSTEPQIKSPIHNHLTWVVIGMFEGEEKNYFYRREGDGIVLAEERTLRAGDVYVMDANAIHAIVNPLPVRNGALHVYGGSLMNRPGRSFWDPDTGAEQAYDFEKVIAFSRKVRAG
jgi:predicted metal-dependent enzyme (double-stranded beta helix superfamily)